MKKEKRKMRTAVTELIVIIKWIKENHPDFDLTTISLSDVISELFKNDSSANSLQLQKIGKRVYLIRKYYRNNQLSDEEIEALNKLEFPFEAKKRGYYPDIHAWLSTTINENFTLTYVI